MPLPTPYVADFTVNDYGLVPSNQIFGIKLDASTNYVFDISVQAPYAERYKALIHVTGGKNVYCALNKPATAYVLNSFEKSPSELINSYYPLCREVTRRDTLNFFTLDTDCVVNIVLYAIRTNS